MQYDFYLSRADYRDVSDILRVDNCSEIEVAGNGYKQKGKFYDGCCDLENVDAPECAEVAVWLKVLFITLGNFFMVMLCLLACYGFIFDKRNTTSCACCEPQPIVGNDNNATRNGTERSSISTISDNLRAIPCRFDMRFLSVSLCKYRKNKCVRAKNELRSASRSRARIKTNLNFGRRYSPLLMSVTGEFSIILTQFLF